jgi:hypothetical protein
LASATEIGDPVSTTARSDCVDDVVATVTIGRRIAYPSGERWLAEVMVWVTPVLRHGQLAKTDEQWFVFSWNALDGRADCTHVVKFVEQLVELFGVGDDVTVGVDANPAVSVSLEDCLVHISTLQARSRPRHGATSTDRRSPRSTQTGAQKVHGIL